MKRNITLQFEDEDDYAIVLVALKARIKLVSVDDSLQVMRGRAMAVICRELQTVNGLGDRHVDLANQAKLPMGVP